MRDDPYTSEEVRDLVARAREGDEGAFTALYNAYFAPLYRFLIVQTRNPVDAEDLAQNVFLKAYEAIGRYRDEGKPFSAWLYRIARNLVIDRARLKKASSLEDLPEAAHPLSSESPLRDAEGREISGAFTVALQDLSEEQRTALTLRLMDDLSYREIGAILEKSEVAVRQMVSRALKIVRTHFSS